MVSLFDIYFVWKVKERQGIFKFQGRGETQLFLFATLWQNVSHFCKYGGLVLKFN